jgi:predicted RNase H-like HicB family nuclease
MVSDIEYYMSLNYTYRFRLITDDLNYPPYYYGGFEELDGCNIDAPTVLELLAELELVKRDWIEIKLERGDVILEPRLYSNN